MPVNRLTVLGDSFSEGWGDPAADGRLRGWVSRFVDVMDLPPGSVLNLAKYGATAYRCARQQLPHAMRDKSPLVVAVVGVNDLLRDHDSFDAVGFQDNLHTIFGSVTGDDTTVITGSYPDIPGNLPVSDDVRRVLRARFGAANDVLEEIADHYGVFCVDLHRPPIWHDPAIWAPDGLHPGPLGHQYFVDEVVRLLGVTSGVVAA